MAELNLEKQLLENLLVFIAKNKLIKGYTPDTYKKLFKLLLSSNKKKEEKEIMYKNFVDAFQAEDYDSTELLEDALEISNPKSIPVSKIPAAVFLELIEKIKNVEIRSKLAIEYIRKCKQ